MSQYSYIKKSEGIRFNSYPDKEGYAICWGNQYHPNGKRVKPGEKANIKYCHKMFSHHIKHEVLPYIKNIKLSKGQKKAVIDYVYQHGCGNFRVKLKPLILKNQTAKILKELDRGYPERKRREMWNE